MQKFTIASRVFALAAMFSIVLPSSPLVGVARAQEGEEAVASETSSFISESRQAVVEEVSSSSATLVSVEASAEPVEPSEPTAPVSVDDIHLGNAAEVAGDMHDGNHADALPITIPENDKGREQATVPMYVSQPAPEKDTNPDDACVPYELTFVSDQKTAIVDGTDVYFATKTYVHPAWTAFIPGAKWIWNAFHVTDPTVDETVTFKNAFYVKGTITTASLEAGFDDDTVIKVGNSEVFSSQGVSGYATATTVDITQDVKKGKNSITAVVKNIGGDADPEANPAGVIYKLSVESLVCDNDGDGEDDGGDDTDGPNGLRGDRDGDGVTNDVDNCPLVANPLQEDTDNDGIGDACDPTSTDNDNDDDGIPDGEDPDDDNDGIPDDTDNDDDGDGIPDPLDNDDDNDGTPDNEDPDGDNDGDGIPNGDDDDDNGNGIPDDQEGDVLGAFCQAAPFGTVTIDEAYALGSGIAGFDATDPIYLGGSGNTVTTGGTFTIHDGTNFVTDAARTGTEEGLVIERQGGSILVHMKKADTDTDEGRNHIHGTIVLSGVRAASITEVDDTLENYTDGLKLYIPSNDEVKISGNGTTVGFWLTTGDDEDTFIIDLKDLDLCEDTNEEDFCGVGVERIANGGFEAPVVTGNGGDWEIIPNLTAGLDWVVEYVSSNPNPGLELQAGYSGWTPKDGDQFAELDGDESSYIYQDIATVPGATYDLAYSFSARPGVVANDLSVKVDGTEVSTQSQDGSALVNTNWIDTTLSFVATGATTRISFENTDASDSLGSFVDAISMKCTENADDGSGDGDGDGGNGDNDDNDRGGSSSSNNDDDDDGEVLGDSTGPEGEVLGVLAQTGVNETASLVFGALLLGALAVLRARSRFTVSR